MTSRTKNRLAAVTIAVMACIGLTFAAAPNAFAASGTINGTVTCFYDNDKEVGVWVDAAVGTDGWASWWSNGNGGINYSYTLSQSSSYALHIGCGGSTSSWKKTFYTYPDTILNGQSYDWICTFQTGLGYICYES